MCSSRCWLITGAVLAGLSVALGAFAAHGLDGYFVEKYAGQTRTVTGEEVPAAVKYLNDFKTGADYQMYHSLALLAVGLLARGQGKTRKSLHAAGWSFLLGIVLFSGSLYLFTTTGQRWLVWLTPIGGVLFLIGWTALALALWSHEDSL